MRSAYDTDAGRRAAAIALVHNGEHAGNILVTWSKGRAATATVSIWAGPWTMPESSSGHAGGYGYDKGSAAVASAASRAGGPVAEGLGRVGGVGLSRIESQAKAAGYVPCVVAGW